MHFSRDAESPNCNVEYIEEENGEYILVKISCDEEVEPVSGFELSEDKKVLSKKVYKNENKILKIKDLSGNQTEVEYEVNNIDKEPPEILGIENGQTYKCPVQFECFDNDEIRDINIDRFGENLKGDIKEVYYSSYFYDGIDKTGNSIKIKMTEHPKNTRMYKYYINDKLYTTVEEDEFIFSGLENGKKYTIKVEAIDNEEKILDTYTTTAKTGYFDEIISNKNSNEFVAKFYGLSTEVSKIKYAIWNYYDENNKIWKEADIENKSSILKFNEFNTNYYASYVMHVYMYDKNDILLDVIGFSVDFNNNYEENENVFSEKNKIDVPGNYQIRVEDVSNNETIYYIKVEE